MSYEKQAWSKYDALKSEEENIENGAVVTDSRMNHMEDGIEVNSNAVENHIANKLNPHSVTKNQVGLGNVQNFDLATENEAKQGTSNAKYMTPSLTQAVLSANINSIAYANSADGTDGFTTVYPNLNLLTGTSNQVVQANDWNMQVADIKYDKSLGGALCASVMINNADHASDLLRGAASIVLKALDQSGNLLESVGGNEVSHNADGLSWCSISIDDNTASVKAYILTNSMNQNAFYSCLKIEPGSTATPWMPSASEVTTSDYPKYVGFSNTVKTNKSASDYTWFPDLTNKVEDHVNNKSNPHGVTAGQTGAYTKDEVESRLLLKAVDSEVVHKENNENISGSKTFTGQTKVNNLEVTGNLKLTSMIGEWVNIPLLTGYAVGDGQTPQVRKVRTAEGLIRIDYRGAIGATSGNLPIAQVTVGTIPTDFLPLGTVLMQGSDNTGRGGRVACLTSGEMRILAPNTSAYVYLNSTFYYQ